METLAEVLETRPQPTIAEIERFKAHQAAQMERAQIERAFPISPKTVEAGVEASALTLTISQSRASQLATALSKAQGEFSAVTKTKTATVKNSSGVFLYSFKYADWSDMLEMLRPVLAKHGLSISQIPKLREGKLRLVTQLMHSSGAVREDDGFVLPEGLEPQKLAGHVTYYKRIAGSAMLGISAEEDTDAPPEEKKGPLPTGLGKRAKAGASEATNTVPSESGDKSVQKMDSRYNRTKEENDRLQVHIRQHGASTVKSFIYKELNVENSDSLTKDQWAVVLQKLDSGALNS